ncbi:hypothetical protein CCR78_05380 [Rhodovulum imhoffii]|nr:hypothetical protein [Rhodovulum imhoffii]
MILGTAYHSVARLQTITRYGFAAWWVPVSFCNGFQAECARETGRSLLSGQGPAGYVPAIPTHDPETTDVGGLRAIGDFGRCARVATCIPDFRPIAEASGTRVQSRRPLCCKERLGSGWGFQARLSRVLPFARQVQPQPLR